MKRQEDGEVVTSFIDYHDLLIERPVKDWIFSDFI